MQIEEGKFYRDGCGDVIGPMRPLPDDGSRLRWIGVDNGTKREGLVEHTYTDDGSYFEDGHESECDLVEEVEG